MKRIFVSGASRGIGRAIAEELAAPETSLLLHGRDSAALKETQRAVEERGARTEIVTCDLSDPDAVNAMALQIAREPLDVLINNGGIAVVKPLADISLGDWQRAIAINVTAPFLLTQKLAPAMPRGGSIVNILSVAAKTGFAGWSSYSTTKFALEGFSQSIREELRPHGIRVINIYPAATATGIWEGVEGEWPREKMMSPEDVADAVRFALDRPPGLLVENISLGRVSGNL
ncbi:MAG: SDR family NAD(P)-dependent oxidoreductase [Chthoniobacterales bacterium]|nr:SDR family NAD(P)-dependent oxidoreductase [Chthoniobacterales bacterium]